MPRSVDGHAGASGAKVWLLGNSHPSADRSIPWDKSFGNLNDPAVIVVDLTTMTESILERIDESELDHARESIAGKFFHGGTIVVVTHPSLLARRHASGHFYNYEILPILPTTETAPEGHTIKASADHIFREYIDLIKKFTFTISKYTLTARCPPTDLREVGLDELPGQTITDGSGNRLGFALRLVGRDRSGLVRQVPGTGRLVILPPPPPESAYDGLGKILSVYGKAPPRREAPPSWAERVSLTRADRMQAEIAELEARAGEIQGQISDLLTRKGKILDHRRLLYAKGPELEEAVVAAFRALGFSEAKRAGGADRADCILDMGTSKYLHGLVEVKGADGRTGEGDIAQCVKWVEKLRGAEGRWSKPIFVPNQYRKKEYPASRKDRLRFEPNELDYAKTRGVCIIPSCVLFEAIRKTLDGAVPDKARAIEEITSTDGPLESVFWE